MENLLTIEQIQKVVCDHLKIPVEVSKCRNRKRKNVEARQISMYFCKMFTTVSLEQIGTIIAGQDHATVIHACKTVRNLIDTDSQFNSKVYQIEQELHNILTEMSVKDIRKLHDWFPEFYPVMPVVPIVVREFKPNPYRYIEQGYYRKEYQTYKSHVV